MSAKVFNPPKGFKPPELDINDFNQYEQVCDNYLKRLKKWCLDNTTSNSNLVGEIIRYGVADGYAQYMVYSTSPLQLIHIDIMDGYSADDIWLRGLRVSDVKTMVAQEKAISKLFAPKK